MATEGIKRELAPGLIQTDLVQTLDVDEEAGVAVEILSNLDLVVDSDRTLESTRQDYQRFVDLGKPGELHLDIPYAAITTSDLVRAFDSMDYPEGRNYPKTDVVDNLWTPGTHKKSYTDEELAGESPDYIEARLALYGNSDKDPLLHFLNLPFDEHGAKLSYIQTRILKEIFKDDTVELEDLNGATQLQELEKAKEEFEKNYTDYFLSGLSHRALIFIAMSRRIKDQEPPIAHPFYGMRDPSLPRRGFMKSFGIAPVAELEFNAQAKANFTWGSGRKRQKVGLGLSIGLKT